LTAQIVDDLTIDLIFHITIFQVVLLLIFLSNLSILRNARRHRQPQNFPTVSILVPARDEERNIARCVQSLLKQDYPSFEILVLDDQSSDQTGSILEKLSLSHPELSIMRGTPPPENYIGKNWACSQLARQAQGDLYLFTDADTVHHPGSLRTIVRAMLGEQADLLTGFPRQEVHSWIERLLVPFFSWAVLCFTPFLLAYYFRLPAFTSAVGQLMLFRRQAYLAVGGHDAVKASIVEDIALARNIRKAGFRWRVVDLVDLISCRMYSEGGEAVKGFVKNLFAAFDFRLVPFLFSFVWLAVMFLEPPVVLILTILGITPQAHLVDLFVCLSFAVLVWLLPYIYLQVPFGLAFLYPLTILANELAALLSLRASFAGRLSWKNRQIARKPWKWW